MGAMRTDHQGKYTLHPWHTVWSSLCDASKSAASVHFDTDSEFFLLPQVKRVTQGKIGGQDFTGWVVRDSGRVLAMYDRMRAPVGDLCPAGTKYLKELLDKRAAEAGKAKAAAAAAWVAKKEKYKREYGA